MKIDLRSYQDDAIEQARQAIRNGAKNVLICAPTGGGKTVIASALIEANQSKGRRSAFVVDRKSLIEQTSSTFDRYGIEHGVIQADHPRFRPSRPTQLCSIQTIARRRWPDADLIVVDEAHTVTETVKKRIEPRDTITVGLTATPFTKGLGKLYDAIVNVTTTNRLIEQGFLSKYRIFACVEPNMEGVKVVAGEWEKDETQKRALQVVGDVVQEYLKHGEDRKFICSAVDTAHVEELQRQFLSAGINVATYTYKDQDEDRAETLVEYRRPDSKIRGLITVTAASKGFDVADIGCVIMARPLRKSLAEHIQFFGRGLRIAEGKADCVILDHSGNCIASGMRVLTKRGLIPIERILSTDEVWDGHEFVKHGGLVNRGVRPVIRYAGLTATADHRVKTAQGWRTLGTCASEQAAIVTTGLGRQAVREREGVFTRGTVAWAERAPLHACLVRVRDLRVSLSHFVQQLDWWSHQGLQRLQPAAPGAEVALCPHPADAEAVHQAAGRAISDVWRTRNRVSILFATGVRSLDSSVSWVTRWSQGLGIGSEGQRRALRARQHPMGDEDRQHEQPARVTVGTDDAQVQARSPGGLLRRCITAWLFRGWNDASRDSQSVPEAITETEGQVWDLLDCGPRNSFTCEGLLVHNCQRFWADMQEFFELGVTELDDGKKKEKPKAKEKTEPEPVKCPQCRHVHKPAPFCPSCGHEYPKRAAVEHVPGTLKELIAHGDQGLMRKKIWPQVVSYVLESTQDLEKAQRKAQAMYRELTGEFAKARVENTTPEPCTTEVRNKIRANSIRWAKGRKSAKPAPTVHRMPEGWGEMRAEGVPA